MTITTVIRSDLFKHTDFTSLEAATIAEHIMACKDMGYISESEIPKLAEKIAETHALVPYEPEPVVDEDKAAKLEQEGKDFATKFAELVPAYTLLDEAQMQIVVQALAAFYVQEKAVAE